MPASFHILVLLIALCVIQPAGALEVPPLKSRVNDYAGLIPAGRAGTLEERLRLFEKETGHQVAVLTIPSLEGEDLEGFSIKVAERWKIGKKGFDNGAILLIAKNDRKLRIEVGYGLEGVLPDAIASRIIRERIVPHFQTNDFAGGIEAGVDAVLKVIGGEPLPEPARNRPAQREAPFSLNQYFLILFLLAFPLTFILSNLNRKKTNRAWVGSGRRRTVDSGGPFWGGLGGGGFGSGGGGGFGGGGGGFGGGGASGSW